jgi:hypothetical protein
MEERISRGERLFLTITALLMIATLFLPWFSGYHEIITTRLVEQNVGTSLDDIAGLTYEELDYQGSNVLVYTPLLDSVSLWRIAQLYRSNDESVKQLSFFDQKNVGSIEDIMLSENMWATYSYDDSTGQENLSLSGQGRDSWGEPPAETGSEETIAEGADTEAEESEPEDIATTMPEEGEMSDSGAVADSGVVSEDTQRDTAHMATVTEISYDKHSLSGFASVLAIGSYGSLVFSGGFALMVSGLLMIVYILCCIGLGAFNLYILNGSKTKDHDKQALYLKKMLRLNWIPVLIWLGMFVLSFFGTTYGFSTEGMIKQVGSSYGVATFIGMSSFGIYLSLGAFLIAALKGKEI